MFPPSLDELIGVSDCFFSVAITDQSHEVFDWVLNVRDRRDNNFENTYLPTELYAVFLNVTTWNKFVIRPGIDYDFDMLGHLEREKREHKSQKKDLKNKILPTSIFQK